MDSAGVKRLPVVDQDGRLAGIVSRADLLKVYLRADSAIRDEIVRDLLSRLWISQSELTVEVEDGVVQVHGEVEQRSMVDIVVRLIRAIDGVVEVVQHVTYRIDDTKTSEPRYYRPLV
jgi:osmotically-inducible protein OsmY